MKKRLSVLLLIFMMILSISSFTTAFADVNDVTASMDTNGTLTITGTGDGAEPTTWNTVFRQYKGVITGISGVAALTFLVFFIINFMKLGQSAGNPQMRSQALLGIVWCGIACAGLGGIAIFFGFFYNILNTGTTT